MSHIPFKLKVFLFLAAVLLMTAIMSGCTSANSVAANREALMQEGDSLASSSNSLSRNGQPVVSLRASSALVGLKQEVNLFAEALDPDGDQLQFSWIASEGTIISQNSNQATWQAPDKAGSVEIVCRVDDRKGGTASARTTIEVVGGRSYELSVQIDRRSIFAASAQNEDQEAAFLPLARAKVSLPNLNLTGVTDASGRVKFALDEGSLIASQTEVIIRYLDWETHYQLLLPSRPGTIKDSIQFFPGFDGVTVAVARGDSFQTKRGGVEVQVVEQTSGEYRPMSEVTVQVGTGQQVAKDGIAFLSTELPGNEVLLRVNKAGYYGLSGYKIPIYIDGLTLVRACMVPERAAFRSEAIVSWTKPYNGAKGVPVTGPFEIGFGQPMEQATIFNDFEMVVQDAQSRTTLVLSGNDISKWFDVAWDGDTIIRLTPKIPLKPLRRYSFTLTRWNAHTRDGRVLRSYAGMFGSFTTDDDGDPKIVSTSPRNGEIGFSRSGPFSLRFDRPMDPSSLKQDLSIEITNIKSGNTISIDSSSLESMFSVEWKENDTMLVLVPRKMLLARTTYLVKLIRSGLRSKSGRGIQTFSNLWGQFSTGDL